MIPMDCNYLKKLALGWISLAMIGCTSTKESVLPQDGPTMQALYEQHMAELYPPAATPPGGRALPLAGIDHYCGFIREYQQHIHDIRDFGYPPPAFPSLM